MIGESPTLVWHWWEAPRAWLSRQTQVRVARNIRITVVSELERTFKAFSSSLMRLVNVLPKMPAFTKNWPF